MDCLFYNYIFPGTSFPQSIWAQYFSIINGTTNKCESYNLKLNNWF